VSAPSTPPPGEQRSESSQNIATAIAEVSERATLLVREEIELAKAEVAEKASKLIRGAIVGAVAGIFVVMAVVFALVGFAWLLYYYLPGNQYTYFWGFFAMAVILLLLGVFAGLVAARAVKKSAPPVPNMAIEEARKIRETVSSGSDAPTSAMTVAPASTDGAQAAQPGERAEAEA
jgi:uncharacterized membrane protein YqjE